MRIRALLLAVGILGCADATSPRRPLSPATPNHAIVVNERDSMPLLVISCAGEVVTGAQFAHQILSFTTPPSGSTIAHFSANYKMTGTGLTDGAKYEGQQQVRDHELVGDAANVYSTRERLLLVSQGNIPNTVIEFDTRAVFNANGDVVFEHNNFTSRCQ